MLITVPDLRRGGGVAHFYERLAPYLPGDTRLLVIGKRLGERGTLSAGARLARDGAGLWRELGADDRSVLIVNPSLDARSLVRDGAVVQAARARGRRVIVFIRGWQDETERTMDGPLGRALAASFLGADAVVVLASRFRAALRRWGYEGPVHTATTAVADDALGAADAGAEAASGGPGGPLNVLFLSRIRADKGVYEALEAVRLAQQQGLDLRVSVAGDGPDLPRAARWVNERGVGHVRFLGDVRGEEKRRLMAASDLYLFPTSHGEGMPATVLEAMAYGMGVVTARVGGLEDFFEDGVHGLVIPDSQPSALAARLETLARDPALRARLGREPQHYARLHFTPRRAAERLLAVVTQVRDAQDGVVAPDTDWFAPAEAGPGAPPEGVG
jgi:glycosyltransferase involved in cell wall biosynthesis